MPASGVAMLCFSAIKTPALFVSLMNLRVHRLTHSFYPAMHRLADKDAGPVGVTSPPPSVSEVKSLMQSLKH